MSEVYAIWETGYEHANIVGLYESRADADADLQAIIDYENTWKAPPDVESDRAWSRWCKWHDQWIKKHPAKATCKGENYSIGALELIAARPTAQHGSNEG